MNLPLPTFRWIRAGALLPLLALPVACAPGCTSLRSKLVDWFTPQYSAPHPAATDSPPKVRLEPVAEGFPGVTDLAFVPGFPRRLVVLQKTGEARVVDLGPPGGPAREVGTLVRLQVRTASELGLLGIAFHPKFSENGLFYLNSNPASGGMRTEISEWKADSSKAGVSTAVRMRTILEVAQPYANHNAGQLAFGPQDGMLYIGLGDGGWRGDPHRTGQDPGALLGKILRIDVDRPGEGGRAYAIPADNPFVGRAGFRPEIWALGVRNPWRHSFDPKGRLIVADVGQDQWEEVSFAPRGGNLGWNVREGRHCHSPAKNCPNEGFVEPIWEYSHEYGQSITGGYVYAGSRLPALRGKYLVGDFTQGRLWALTLPEGDSREATSVELGQFEILLSTFGQDADGEIYVGDFGKGVISRLTAAE